MFLTLRCKRAKRSEECFCFRESWRERRSKSRRAFLRGLGASTFVPSERVMNDSNPKSTPTMSSGLLTSLGSGSGRSTSQVRLKNQRSASREIVAERMRAFPAWISSRSLSVRSLVRTFPMRGSLTCRGVTRMEPVRRALLSSKLFFRLKREVCPAFSPSLKSLLQVPESFLGSAFGDFYPPGGVFPFPAVPLLV